MASRWPTASVGEIAAKIASGPFGSSIRSSEYVLSGVPVIRGFNLAGPRFTAKDFAYLTEDKAKQLSGSAAWPDDIVFAARGTVGSVGIVPREPHDKYILSSNLIKLTVDREKADPLFIFYYFRSHYGQHEIQSYVSTTGVPKIARALESLGKFRVPAVPLPEQRAIAHILGTLDDKIELNRRMSETLEAMARALFKSWFIDFDPVRAKIEGRWRRGQSLPGLPAHLYDLFPDRLVDSELGEIPEGWVVRSLDEIAHFLNGLALQKYPPSEDRWLPVIKIAQLRAGHTVGADRASADLDPDYIVEDGDVLFSWSGSLECVLWAGGLGALNQHLFKVTSGKYPKWFYYFWIHEHLPEFRYIAAGKATTMGHIQRHHLEEAKVIVPSVSTMVAANILTAPLFDQMLELRIQSRTLAALRDALLPKLISGELRLPAALCARAAQAGVKDAERIVRRAG